MPIKILSVDDENDLELLLTQYFRRKIRKGEYEFHFAHNGIEALTMLIQHKNFDIILSDINMPEMDGLTLLSKVNEMRNPALKCIMVSAYGDMGNIRQAMNNGAFDFATKPIDLDDLSVTIEKAVEQIQLVKQFQKEHTQLESIKSDLAVAGEIQQAILPRVFPPFPENSNDLDLAALMVPAKDVGGDFYDFFRIDENRIGLVIADVSGKGVPAAIFMAVSRTLIRALGMQGANTSTILSQANDLLCKESVDCMFVTVFYAIYNVHTGVVNYCNAGHNSPYIIKKSGEVEALPVSTNCMIGAIEQVEFKEATMQMEPGDMLVMFTDGVNEAVNTTFEEYGDERFESVLKDLHGNDSKTTIEGVLESVKSFTGEAPQSDDITLLALKRK